MRLACRPGAAPGPSDVAGVAGLAARPARPRRAAKLGPAQPVEHHLRSHLASVRGGTRPGTPSCSRATLRRHARAGRRDYLAMGSSSVRPFVAQGNASQATSSTRGLAPSWRARSSRGAPGVVAVTKRRAVAPSRQVCWRAEAPSSCKRPLARSRLADQSIQPHQSAPLNALPNAIRTLGQRPASATPSRCRVRQAARSPGTPSFTDPLALGR